MICQPADEKSFVADRPSSTACKTRCVLPFYACSWQPGKKDSGDTLHEAEDHNCLGQEPAIDSLYCAHTQLGRPWQCCTAEYCGTKRSMPAAVRTMSKAFATHDFYRHGLRSLSSGESLCVYTRHQLATLAYIGCQSGWTWNAMLSPDNAQDKFFVQLGLPAQACCLSCQDSWCIIWFEAE